METIFRFLHYFIALMFTATAFVLDVIFKLALGIIFGVFVIFLICIYPLVKNWHTPRWINNLYDYVVTPRKSLCVKIWNLWTEGV